MAAASLCALRAQAQCVASRRLRAGGARDLQAASAATSNCSSALDLVFVLDASGSIGAQPFRYALNFINATLAAFDFDENRVSSRHPRRACVFSNARV